MENEDDTVIKLYELKKYGKAIKYVKRYFDDYLFPTKINEDHNMLFSEDNVIGIFPSQELPEKWKNIYKAKITLRIKQLEKMIDIFKRDDIKDIDVFMSEEYTPILFRGENELIGIAPVTMEEENEDVYGPCLE